MFSQNRIYGYYLLREHGAIICTSTPRIAPTENNLFIQLQENVKKALKPLIDLIDKAYEEESEKYLSEGGRLSLLPDDHPASILLNLKCVLEASEKFFGKYKPPLPSNAIPNNSPYLSIDTWALALSNLTHVDYKEAYKLLLKINACKKQYHYVNPTPDEDESEDGYRKGRQEITSFASFQKKIEKSIAYLLVKANQEIEQDKPKKRRAL